MFEPTDIDIRVNMQRGPCCEKSYMIYTRGSRVIQLVHYKNEKANYLFFFHANNFSKFYYVSLEMQRRCYSAETAVGVCNLKHTKAS